MKVAGVLLILFIEWTVGALTKTNVWSRVPSKGAKQQTKAVLEMGGYGGGKGDEWDD